MVSSYRDCYFIAFAGFIFTNLGKKLLGVFFVFCFGVCLFVCVCVYFWFFLPLAWRLLTSKSFSRLFGFFSLNCFCSFFPLVWGAALASPNPRKNSKKRDIKVYQLLLPWGEVPHQKSKRFSGRFTNSFLPPSRRQIRAATIFTSQQGGEGMKGSSWSFFPCFVGILLC